MKYRRKILTILCLVCLSNFIYLSGCVKNSTPVKIGVAGTMTGINSDLSVSGRRGVELAIEEFNKAGGLNGRKIELVVKDDKNDAATALYIDKEFIKEKISVVIGHYTSGMLVNSMNYLRDKEILFLGPTISADSLSGIDDNFITFIATTKEQAIVLADVANKNGNKKFAIIYDLENKGFNDALYNNFKKLLEADKGQVTLTKTYSSNSKVNSSILAKDVAESNVDALFIIANSSDNADITQQIRKIGCKVQIYSPLWSNTVDLIKKGGTAIDGMFIVGAIDLNAETDDFIKFKKNYIDKYEENPTFSSMYSYETATSLFQAMKMGPDLKPSTIKNNIIQIKDFKGLESNFQIDKFGDSTRKYMIFKVGNGNLRKVD
jgi:branched-chain amino acid transport system substrate-binding protein